MLNLSMAHNTLYLKWHIKLKIFGILLNILFIVEEILFLKPNKKERVNK